MRDNNNSPRIIKYRDINRGNHSQNPNSQYGEDSSLSTFLETIEGRTIALISHTTNFMIILDKMMTILGFVTTRISTRMSGVPIQRTAATDTPTIQTWVGKDTGHQTTLDLDKIKAVMSLVANNLLLL